MYNRNSNFQNIINERNIKKFSENILNRNGYENILKKLAGIGLAATLSELERIDIRYIDILDILTIIATRYAKVIPKSRGAESGLYGFNVIQVDDRLDKSEQIATIIHELSHHLFAEIFEQTMMVMLECDKTDAIESFVGYTLKQDRIMVLINEYCASTVEGRFIPFDYQNYGSFNNLLMTQFNPQRDMDLVHSALAIGNTFAQDIIKILEIMIPPEFREEIKMQYKRDFRRPESNGILLETHETIPEDFKYGFISTSIAIAMENASSGEFDQMLNEYETVFKKINRL